MGKAKPAPQADEPTTAEIETSAPAPVAGTDIAAQTDAMTGDWPEVQPHAVAAMKEGQSTQEATPEASDTATPKKKRGRPPGSNSKVSTLARKDAVGNTPKNTAKAAVSVDYKVMGSQCAQLTFLIGTLVGGADFAPMAKNPLTDTSDQEMMTDAYAKYAEAKQMNDLPPGVALCATLMVYVASRLQFPNTQSRLQKLGVMMKNVWGKIRGRKNGSRIDGGNDVVRKDDAKQEASAPA
jgi:hypothetical protein